MRILILIIFILNALISIGQDLTVCGTVYGDSMKPLSYATIQIKRNGKFQGAMLTDNGRFCARSLQENDTLIFTSIGYSMWKHAVTRNTTISLQLEQQIFKPALYGSYVYLDAGQPVKYVYFSENESADTSGARTLLSFDQNNSFTRVEISPGYRGKLHSLGEILSNDIRVKKQSVKEIPLTIRFNIHKDTITNIRILQLFDTKTKQQIIHHLLENTEWTAAVLNGRHMVTICELNFLATVKKHRLILKLQYR